MIHNRTLLFCCLFLALVHVASAGDNTCGVNYFNGWCKDKKEETSAYDKKPADGPYVWQPRFANEPPPPLVDVFRDPSPENAARYREWYKKRMDRVRELGGILSGADMKTQSSDLNKQSQPPSISTKPQLQAGNETKPVIFNKAVYFFSEACPVCARMTPLLSEFQSTGKLVGIGINSTDRGTASYLQRNGVQIPSAGDYSGDIAGNYGVTAVPALILLNEKGVIVGRHEGVLDKAALSKLFGMQE